MKIQEARKWLALLGVPKGKIGYRTGWTQSPCPLAQWRHEGGISGDEVFGVREEVGDSFCNCFSCGWHGLQTDLVWELVAHYKASKVGYDKKDLAEALSMALYAEDQFELPNMDSPDVEALHLGEVSNHTVFPDWWVESFPPYYTSTYACNYLHGRGVLRDVANALELRFDPVEKRICFPVRNFAGEYMGVHGRACLNQTKPRYRMYSYADHNNPIIWLGEHWVDLDKPLVIAEGPFDLASIYRVYRNVACPLFANPSFEKMKRMLGAEIITVLDKGTGGDKGRERFTALFGSENCTHIIPPAAYDDAGAMPREAVYEMLEDYIPIRDVLLD